MPHAPAHCACCVSWRKRPSWLPGRCWRQVRVACVMVTYGHWPEHGPAGRPWPVDRALQCACSSCGLAWQSDPSSAQPPGVGSAAFAACNNLVVFDLRSPTLCKRTSPELALTVPPSPSRPGSPHRERASARPSHQPSHWRCCGCGGSRRGSAGRQVRGAAGVACVCAARALPGPPGRCLPGGVPPLQPPLSAAGSTSGHSSGSRGSRRSVGREQHTHLHW